MDGLALIIKQLDTMNGRLDRIEEAGSERGRRIWEKLSDQDKTLAILEHRFTGLETAVNGQALTLAEYQRMKQKAEGAGWLGRKLWGLGGVLLSVAGGIYYWWSAIAGALKWLVGKVP
jgi:hypothetical protein